MIGLVLKIMGAAIASFALTAGAAPVVPPKGGAAIILKSPVWLTGVSSPEDKMDLAPYAKQFPVAVNTEHLRVVNAGYWIANQDKPSQVFYEFAMTIAKPFAGRVFTRALLQNPAEPDQPIKYEHYLDPKEKSTKATHGPLANITRGE